MVVERDGLKYTVEVKGKWAGRRGGPPSFTADEVDWASRFADRHIICVAYVDRDACIEVECIPSAEFQKKWILQTERGIEYRYLAYRRGGKWVKLSQAAGIHMATSVSRGFCQPGVASSRL